MIFNRCKGCESRVERYWKDRALFRDHRSSRWITSFPHTTSPLCRHRNRTTVPHSRTGVEALLDELYVVFQLIVVLNVLADLGIGVDRSSVVAAAHQPADGGV